MVETEDPAVGVMETNWAENRAKLPQDFIRKSIGTLLDSVYSTGERDKYRTRVERNPNGGTDIYIAHRGMVEVYTNTQKDDTAWQPRPSDPELESIMLSRLLLKLGGKEDAAQAVATAQPPSQPETRPGPVPRSLADVPNSIALNEGFDRAWPPVGQSLDRHGLHHRGPGPQAGPVLPALCRPQPGRQGRAGLLVAPVRFGQGVHLGSLPGGRAVRGRALHVLILDDKGQQQTNEMAKRILQLLMEDLR